MTSPSRPDNAVSEPARADDPAIGQPGPLSNASPTQKRRVVVFDRDNTLILASGYLNNPADIRLMPGAAAAVARAKRCGLCVAVASNQSGVARGLMTEDDVRRVNARLDELLRAGHPDALVDLHLFCPHHPDAPLERYRQACECRKPSPGMILQAMRELDADGGFCIGDAPRDIAAGRSAGLATLLFRPDPDSLGTEFSPSPAATEHLDVIPDYTVATLQEAMDIIERLTSAPGMTSRGRPARPSATQTPDTPPSAAALPGRANHPPTPDLTRIEQRLDAVLSELRRRPAHDGDFSVARVFAGIAQVMALAVAVLAYVAPPQAGPVILLLLAIFLQGLTTSLLLMGRR